MEWALPYVVYPTLLQANKSADDFDYVYARQNLLYGVLADQVFVLTGKDKDETEEDGWQATERRPLCIS
jgi:hypothetical protein